MTTITVNETTLERFKNAKQELEAAQERPDTIPADEFLTTLLDTWDAVDEGHYTDPEAAEIADEVAERLDVGPGEVATDVNINDVQSELRKLQELVDKSPERVAEELR